MYLKVPRNIWNGDGKLWDLTFPIDLPWVNIYYGKSGIYVTTNYLTTKRYVKNVLDNNDTFLRKSIERVKKRLIK